MKKKSHPLLLRILDETFSRYIRLRDADTHGQIRCISCGRVHSYYDTDCGHYIPRTHMATRYDERNCNGQCRACNRLHSGNHAGYTRGLTLKYGLHIIDELNTLKHTIKKWDTYELEEMITHYKKEIETLKHKLP